MEKPDIVDGDENDLREFVVAIVGIAAKDHHEKRSKRRSGAELCQMTTIDYRGFHCSMATGIYNKSRRSLALAYKTGDEIKWV